MNFERFIARRISSTPEKRFSSLIIKIAIAAVSLSMVVMIITTSVITGFKNQISTKVFNFWGHIHITDGNSTNTFELIPIPYDADLIDSLKAIGQVTYSRRNLFREQVSDKPETTLGGVRRVQPFLIVPGIVSSRDQFEGLLLKGITDEYDMDRLENFMREGDLIQFSDAQASRDLVISEQTARRMNFRVGQRVILHFILDGDQVKRAFTIKGIYKTGLEEYDRRFALVDMRVLQDIMQLDRSQIGGYEVYLDNIRDLQLLNEYIYFEKLTGPYSNLYSETIRSKFFQIFEWLDLQNINERVIIILMILVALINMVTALLIFVLERVQMIGILKALGANNWSVRRIFLYNAGQILLKGLLIGNLVALGLGYLQKSTGLLKLREQDYYLDTVPIEFNLWTLILINGGAIVVIMLFLIIPSALVSQITPVKAIQFK